MPLGGTRPLSSENASKMGKPYIITLKIYTLPSLLSSPLRKKTSLPTGKGGKL
jgi:hypothetical protein